MNHGPLNSPAGRTFAEARWLAAVSEDMSLRKELCDIITHKRNPENRLQANSMWLAAWDAIEAVRLAQEAAAND
jgi:hypothetical protein